MSKLFITGDLHLGHTNIIKYTGRPFKDIDHMNNELIRRWNSRVKNEDTVIHDGDFCFYSKNNEGGNGIDIKSKSWREQLNGNIIFIKGNHDKRSNGVFTPIMNMVIRYGGQDIFITHRPQDMNTYYPINFVAHSHEKWEHKFVYDGEKRILLINVGVDVWDFYPRVINEILDKYRRLF